MPKYHTKYYLFINLPPSSKIIHLMLKGRKRYTIWLCIRYWYKSSKFHKCGLWKKSYFITRSQVDLCYGEILCKLFYLLHIIKRVLVSLILLFVIFVVFLTYYIIRQLCLLKYQFMRYWWNNYTFLRFTKREHEKNTVFY